MNQIKQGYKQTKVGVIPEDWEIKYIEDIAEVKGGKRLPLGHELTEAITPYPYIRVTNMSMGGLNDKQILYVPSEVQPKIKNYTISKDDLYIAVAGNTLGMVGTIPAKFDGANLTENADKICNIKMNKEFLLFVLMSDLIQNVIQNEITTNAQPKLALTRIKKFRILFPPLKEQEKIAQILTTWDEAITKQTELLRAKELLKIALMQKLLSGEVRFSGFSDKWEEVRLGEICKITTGKLNANAMVENGEYTFFTCARDTYKIDEFAFDTEALLVSGNGANVGYIHYFNGKFNAYQRTYVLDGFKHNIFLIKYLLDKYLSLQISREKNEGNTPYITLPTLTKMKLKLPSLAEQQKIAEVLSLVDDEINLLKNELEELKLQKKALMQKLLTGEVRVKA